MIRINDRGYLQTEFVQSFSKNNHVTGNIYSSPSLNDALIDHFEHKLEHLLKWEDHNSMWFSLESRVPFLDHNLVEKTLSLPSEKIIKRATTKFILRKSLKGILPENIRNRNDKIGFATPAGSWFRTENFKSLIYSIILSDSFKTRGYLNHNSCIKKYQLHLDNRINIAKDIWKWINLEVWFRTFIDK